MVGKGMNGCNKVKQIAWVKYQGALYGIAHNSKGEGIGAVRVDNYENGLFAIAYSLSISPVDNQVSSTKISGNKSASEDKQKRVVESSLRKLLGAA